MCKTRRSARRLAHILRLCFRPLHQFSRRLLPFQRNEAGEGAGILRLMVQQSAPDPRSPRQFARIFKHLRVLRLEIDVQRLQVGGAPDDRQRLLWPLQCAERPRLLNLKPDVIGMFCQAALRNCLRLPRSPGQAQGFGEMRQGFRVIGAAPQAGFETAYSLFQAIQGNESGT